MGASSRLVFQALKDDLLHKPILKWYDPNHTIKLATNASGTTMNDILQQKWEYG